MGGPKDGKYYILPAVDPKILVGVDGVGLSAPIITDGKYNVFSIKKTEDGNYTFILEASGGQLFVQDDKGKLVASIISPLSEWTIGGADCGPYTIEQPSCLIPKHGWTVKDREPKSEVTISTVENPVQPKQQWNFVPWSAQE